MINNYTHAFSKDSTLKFLLFIGILLRIILWIVMRPQNPDPHHEVLEYIVKFHRLPASDKLFLACHPPLYYLTALPFFLLGGLKLTQFYSLLTSCLNLWVMYMLLKKTIPSVLIRNICFLLPTFLYMYLEYSMYVSNDSLAVLMGTCFFYFLYEYLQKRTIKSELLLALFTGLALLTKATFLPFVPVTMMIIFLIRIDASLLLFLRSMLLTGFVIVLTGSYKLLENYHNFHVFFVHNLDIFPLPTNAIFYQGIQSWLNINILTLIEDPNLSSRNPSIHAAPLLLYGTFWYKHVYFENNLTFGNYSGFRYIGSVFYLIGILPTFTILMGLMILLKRGITLLIALKKTFVDKLFEIHLFNIACLILLLGSFATMITGILKYNDWAFMHTRLLVHVFYPIILALSIGLTFLQKRNLSLFRYTTFSMVGFALLSVFYVNIEAFVVGFNWLYYGDKDYIQWYVNKDLGL